MASRFIRGAFPFWLSLLLLTAISVPGCLKKKDAALLDGGHTVKHEYESYWSPESFPIVVFISDTDPEEFVTGAVSAAKIWNLTLGLPVFETHIVSFDEAAPKGCGWITMAAKEDLGPAGFWTGRYYDGTSEICYGKIDIRSNVKEKNITKIYIHELGHALGLAHDKGDKRSIMYPTVFTDYPQYIMPDDGHSIINMMTGQFTPLPKGTRAEIQRIIQSL